MSEDTNFASTYLKETILIAQLIEPYQLDTLAGELHAVRARHGRVFFLGLGGSAANASHAVNDFRKLACVQAFTPSDNVSEVTAWANDDSWPAMYMRWLRSMNLSANDAIFVLSVGGGVGQVSAPIIQAVEWAKTVGATILGIVGRTGGVTAERGTTVILVPTVNTHTVTPHTEEFQSILLHLLVSHPLLKITEAKWESLTAR